MTGPLAPDGGTIDLARPRRVHFVGLGGAGMSGIAKVLLQRGHDVSGSDLHWSPALEALQAMGARVSVGHDAGAITEPDVVVVSSAVPATNVEVVAARARGLPVVHRSGMLAALMTGHRAVVIAGTHGKTTTTSMTVVGMQSAGGDPSYSIGGALNEAGSNAHSGTDPLFVAEADESDRSFLAYGPDLAVVTNVDLDHHAEFADEREIAAAFALFLDRRVLGGPAVICEDDPGGAALAREARAPVITYGRSPQASVRVLVEGDGRARLTREGHDVVGYRLAVPGRHNLLNAAAALIACEWAGADVERAAAGLADFGGAQRRFQRLGSAGGVDVVDDYAHHPTELRANLAAARSLRPGRVVLVVQPHLYSRTAAIGRELGRAAAAADVVVVTDVYGAREQPVPGISGTLVVEGARDAGANVLWIEHLADVPGAVADLVQSGDLVLVTGAGDVTQVGPRLLQLLRDRGG